MVPVGWTYYAPGEVRRAVEHIDILVERGIDPDLAAEDAARIYRARTADYRTRFLKNHLLMQWRVWRRGGPGGIPGAPRPARPPAPRRWRLAPPDPGEVNLRAFFYRLFYE